MPNTTTPAAVAATLEQIQAADPLTMLLVAATSNGFAPQERRGYAPETIYDVRDRTYAHYLIQVEDDDDYAAWRDALRDARAAAEAPFDVATTGLPPQMVGDIWFAMDNALRAAVMVGCTTAFGVADQAAALAYRWTKAVADRAELAEAGPEREAQALAVLTTWAKGRA